MARLCPQCGEIHFETSTNPLPPDCRKCGANLHEASGLMPALQLEDAEASTPTAQPRPKPKGAPRQWGKTPGFKGIVTGLVILVIAGVTLYFGWDWHSRVKEAKANVYASNDAPKWAKRDRVTATYTVGTKKYPQYPGLRREGDTFTVYYLPEDPATGYETKPFLWLVIGGKVLLIGLGVLAFGLMRFSIGRAQIADHHKVMANAG